MNTTLVNFERAVNLGPTFAAKLLGVSYSTYAQYRSESRRLPKYHRNHVQCLLLLPQRSLARMIREHVNG